MPSEPSHPRPRSRSPHRPRDDHRIRKATRSRSPLRDRTHSTRDRHSHHHHSKDHRHHRDSKPRDRTRTTTPTAAALPSNARPLSRADLPAFEPLFAHYLDLQKGLDLAALDAAERKGRWKSFVGKWNRAELAAGWYDPETFERVRGEYVHAVRAVAPVPAPAPAEGAVDEGGEDDEEDDYGPSLPSARGSGSAASGPNIPTLSDLTLRAEQAAADRDASFADLRAARKEDRKQQKERLDDLVPRAEAGTRERMLEKRREVGDKMRAFRERSPGDEVGDEELVGGGGGDEIKRMLEREKVKVSERQLRREAVAREVAAEREERVKAYREREEETMGKLRELARRRFG